MLACGLPSLCLILLPVVHMADAQVICLEDEDAFKPDPYRCDVFHRCYDTVLFTYKCSSGMSFNPTYSVCVDTGSMYDVCTATRKDVNPICLTSDRTLLPHPTKCSLYYDCTRPARGSQWELNLQECDYPFLYNNVTERCEHYSMVDCGSRDMPYWICQYKYTECPVAHCRPCAVDHPDCRSLPNGLHPIPSRPGSRYYVVCKDNRAVSMGECPLLTTRMPYTFDPVKRVCVPPF